MLSLTLNLMHLFYGATLWDRYIETTTMNAMNLSILILTAFYLLAIVERFTQTELINDAGESEGYDNYAEQQYNNTKDYYLAADNGYVGDW